MWQLHVLCNVSAVSMRSAAGSPPIFTQVLQQQAAALKTSPLCIDLTPETHCSLQTDVFSLFWRTGLIHGDSLGKFLTLHSGSKSAKCVVSEKI